MTLAPAIKKERTAVLGQRGMARVAFLCCMALGVNGVLIQTVVPTDSPVKNAVRVAVLSLALFAALLHNSHLPRWLVVTGLLSAALLLLRDNPDQLSYVFVLTLAPMLWSSDERRLEKWLAVASLLGLGLVFIFLKAGITHDEILMPRDRHTFGTAGVPFFYNVVYGAATLLVLYVRKHRVKGRGLVLVGTVGAATWFFLRTDARGGYFSFLAFVALLAIVPAFRRVAPFRWLVAWLPAIFLGGTFYLASQWSDDSLNALFSHRPTLYARFLSSLDTNDVLLSTSVKAFDTRDTIVDSSYLHLLVGGGLVLCAVFVVTFASAVRNLFALGRHADIAFLVATCCYCASESILLRIENLFVIYAWYLVLRYCQRREAPDARPEEVAARPAMTAPVRTHSGHRSR